MIDSRAKMLATTVRKLYQRGARVNIQKILEKTHEADIANVLENFSKQERVEIFRLCSSDEKRGEVLSHLEAHVQEELLSSFDQKEIKKIMSYLDSDDAAGLLRNVSEDFANEVLASMDKEESEDVADLLGYPEGSSGALMNSDFLSLKQDMTVAQAIGQIQDQDEDLAITFYVYVVNDSGHLVGVISLKQMLLNRKNEVLKNIMSRDIISAEISQDQEEVAKMVEHYDFLSIPVTDAANKLMGVITVDDVLDVIRAESEEDLLAMGQVGIIDEHPLSAFRARAPWLFLAFIGGIACFTVIKMIASLQGRESLNHSVWLVVSFLPLMLTMGTTAGNQATTVAIGVLSKIGHLETKKIFSHVIGELTLCLGIAFVFLCIIGGLGILFYPEMIRLCFMMAIALVLQMLLSVGIGSSVPFFLNRLSIDPVVGSVPLLTTVINLTAVTVLFLLAFNFGGF